MSRIEWEFKAISEGSYFTSRWWNWLSTNTVSARRCVCDGKDKSKRQCWKRKFAQIQPGRLSDGDNIYSSSRDYQDAGIQS